MDATATVVSIDGDPATRVDAALTLGLDITGLPGRVWARTRAPLAIAEAVHVGDRLAVRTGPGTVTFAWSAVPVTVTTEAPSRDRSERRFLLVTGVILVSVTLIAFVLAAADVIHVGWFFTTFTAGGWGFPMLIAWWSHTRRNRRFERGVPADAAVLGYHQGTNRAMVRFLLQVPGRPEPVEVHTSFPYQMINRLATIRTLPVKLDPDGGRAVLVDWSRFSY